MPSGIASAPLTEAIEREPQVALARRAQAHAPIERRVDQRPRRRGPPAPALERRRRPVVRARDEMHRCQPTSASAPTTSISTRRTRRPTASDAERNQRRRAPPAACRATDELLAAACTLLVCVSRAARASR